MSVQGLFMSMGAKVSMHDPIPQAPEHQNMMAMTERHVRREAKTTDSTSKHFRSQSNRAPMRSTESQLHNSQHLKELLPGARHHRTHPEVLWSHTTRGRCLHKENLHNIWHNVLNYNVMADPYII